MRTRTRAPQLGAHLRQMGIGMVATGLAYAGALAVVLHLFAARQIGGFEAGVTLGALGALTGLSWALLGAYGYYLERREHR